MIPTVFFSRSARTIPRLTARVVSPHPPLGLNSVTTFPPLRGGARSPRSTLERAAAISSWSRGDLRKSLKPERTPSIIHSPPRCFTVSLTPRRTD